MNAMVKTPRQWMKKCCNAYNNLLKLGFSCSSISSRRRIDYYFKSSNPNDTVKADKIELSGSTEVQTVVKVHKVYWQAKQDQRVIFFSWASDKPKPIIIDDRSLEYTGIKSLPVSRYISADIFTMLQTTHLSPRKPSRLMHALNMGFFMLQLPPCLHATIPFTCGRGKTLNNYLAGVEEDRRQKLAPTVLSLILGFHENSAHYGDLPLQCNRAVVSRVASVSTTLPEGNRELYP
ncbi:hypothetical protein B0H19DRAFT_1066467 [Mycena capillaripes]|nr:hypothetical protein B0H19DRAFT_1066467 [Mycena capillaripes]